MTEQQKEQLRQQIQQSVHDAVASAREAGRVAREAGAAARAAGAAARSGGQGPDARVIEIPNGPPIDPIMIRQTVENISYAVLATIAIVAIGVPLVRALGRRLGPAPVAPPLPPQVAEQLQRIERAVDSMAIEIERISESQRFIMKLQTGQGESAALPRASSGS